jgi:uncharacterized membrane protein YccC
MHIYITGLVSGMACFSSACIYAQAPGARRQRHAGWQGRTRAEQRAEREQKASQSARRPILFAHRQQNEFSPSEKNALYLAFAGEKQSTERKPERGIDTRNRAESASLERGVDRGIERGIHRGHRA